MRDGRGLAVIGLGVVLAAATALFHANPARASDEIGFSAGQARSQSDRGHGFYRKPGDSNPRDKVLRNLTSDPFADQSEAAAGDGSTIICLAGCGTRNGQSVYSGHTTPPAEPSPKTTLISLTSATDTAVTCIAGCYGSQKPAAAKPIIAAAAEPLAPPPAATRWMVAAKPKVSTARRQKRTITTASTAPRRTTVSPWAWVTTVVPSPR
jgi:hypothetical protein